MDWPTSCACGVTCRVCTHSMHTRAYSALHTPEVLDQHYTLLAFYVCNTPEVPDQHYTLLRGCSCWWQAGQVSSQHQRCGAVLSSKGQQHLIAGAQLFRPLRPASSCIACCGTWICLPGGVLLAITPHLDALHAHIMQGFDCNQFSCSTLARRTTFTPRCVAAAWYCRCRNTAHCSRDTCHTCTSHTVHMRSQVTECTWGHTCHTCTGRQSWSRTVSSCPATEGRCSSRSPPLLMRARSRLLPATTSTSHTPGTPDRPRGTLCWHLQGT
jgi:hypothetical protein